MERMQYLLLVSLVTIFSVGLTRIYYDLSTPSIAVVMVKNITIKGEDVISMSYYYEVMHPSQELEEGIYEYKDKKLTLIEIY